MNVYLQNLNFRRSYIITTVSSSTSTSVLLDAILLVTDFASSRDFAIRSLVLLATLVVGALELVEGIISGFSRDWLRWCVAKWTDSVRAWQKPLPQISHLKGFSSAWIYLKYIYKNKKVLPLGPFKYTVDRLHLIEQSIYLFWASL